MTSNMVTLIIPLRMTDQGLNYGAIGSVIAFFSIGLIIIKIFNGYLSDIVGIKKSILLSILLSLIALIGLYFSSSLQGYQLFLIMIGIASRGKSYGNIMGVSSFLTAFGGVIAAVLYKFNDGRTMFLVVALAQIIAFVLMLFMPDTLKQKKTLSLLENFKELTGIHQKFLILLGIVVLQTLVTSPMWNLVFPLHFYRNFSASVIVLGVFMSLDEFIGGPAYSFGGYVCDKIGATRLCSISFVGAAISCVILAFIPNAYLFGVLFLICSIFVTGSYVALPVAESYYVREEKRGFEFALISFLASIGDMIGNYSAGLVTEHFGIIGWVTIFSVVYIGMAYIIEKKVG